MLEKLIVQQLRVAISLMIILGNLLLLADAKAGVNGNLRVTVDGLKEQKGQVCLSVFGSGKGFPADGKRALQGRCVKVDKSSVMVNFGNLKAGSYAIAVIHDANADGNLNSNLFGIPTEGFGFSRNPMIRTGPPKFSDSAVFVAGPSTDIKIQLQYLLRH